MNDVILKDSELKALISELEAAESKFTTSYKLLEERLTGLTSRGFTGEAAEALIAKFNSTLKPNSEELIRVVAAALSTMREKEVGFQRLMANLTDTANM
jgi:hypothetical protein